MGNKQSTTSSAYDQTMSFVNQSITSNVMNVNNSCKQVADATNIVSIRGDPVTNALIAQVAKDCVDAGWPAAKCYPTITVDGAAMEAKAFPTSSCELSAAQQTDLTSKVSNDMENKMSDETDSLGQTMRSVFSGMTGSKDTKEIRNNASFQNLMNTMTSTNTTNAVLQQTSASNRLEVLGVMGNTNIRGVRMKAEVQALQTALNASTVGQQFTQDLANTAAQSTTVKETGVFDTVKNLGTAFFGYMKANTIVSGIGLTICILAVAFCAYKTLMSPAAQAAITKAANAAAGAVSGGGKGFGGGGGLKGLGKGIKF